MSYEKVKILGTVSRPNKDTGKISNFLEVEVLQKQTMYLNDSMLVNLGLFDRMKGREVLIPASWGIYRDKPSLSFEGDGMPIPITQVSGSFDPVPAPQSDPMNKIPGK